MRRWVGAALLTIAAAVVPLKAPAQDRPRFAEVNLRILTMGDRQPLKEVGTFSSSLPLGKSGTLHRTLTIVNQTRGANLTLTLSISATPSLDDEKVLHCVVSSEASPAEGKSVRRAKDVAFGHPGEQVMQLFADSGTGTRVSLAISASLADQRASDAPGTFPPVNFLVRVQQWNGAQRVELENVQLQSLNGTLVTHDYQRKVPRWVEGEQGAEGAVKGESLAIDGLPVLDLANGSPTIKAGQGFSIALTPQEQEKMKKEAKKHASRDFVPIDGPAPEPGQPKAPSRKIVWDVEFYHLSLVPVALAANRLVLRVTMRGQVMDAASKALAPPVDLAVEKSLLPGEPSPFFLTREATGGPQGYAVWVIPQWSVVPPPESLPEIPSEFQAPSRPPVQAGATP